MANVRTVKDALARLACRDRGATDRRAADRGDVDSGVVDRGVVDRAERAVRDVEVAGRFREAVGLARLGAAVEAADGERAERGAAALSAFEAFEAAARTDAGTDQHFRRGDGTDIRGDGERVGNDAGDPHR